MHAIIIQMVLLRSLLSSIAEGDGGMVDLSCLGMFSGFEVASTIIALGFALWWLVVRKTASYAWVLQVNCVDFCEGVHIR